MLSVAGLGCRSHRYIGQCLVLSSAEGALCASARVLNLVRQIISILMVLKSAVTNDPGDYWASFDHRIIITISLA